MSLQGMHNSPQRDQPLGILCKSTQLLYKGQNHRGREGDGEGAGVELRSSLRVMNSVIFEMLGRVCDQGGHCVRGDSLLGPRGGHWLTPYRGGRVGGSEFGHQNTGSSPRSLHLRE